MAADRAVGTARRGEKQENAGTTIGRRGEGPAADGRREDKDASSIHRLCSSLHRR